MKYRSYVYDIDQDTLPVYWLVPPTLTPSTPPFGETSFIKLSYHTRIDKTEHREIGILDEITETIVINSLSHKIHQVVPSHAH